MRIGEIFLTYFFCTKIVNSLYMFLCIVVLLCMAITFSDVYAVFDSPLKQIQQGTMPNDVMCNDGKVLAFRDNGKVACVYEGTAEKLDWSIINTDLENSSDDALLNSLSFDLSGIKIKSNILEGDYVTGLYTKSMNDVIRAPPPLPFATELNYIVNQDGSADFSRMSSLDYDEMMKSLSTSSQSAIKTPEEYLKYFPTYIPDGQELKFFTFEGHELGAKLLLVYAPIVVSVDPLKLDQGRLLDMGGIYVSINDHPNEWSEDWDDKYVDRGFDTIESYGPNNIKVIHGNLTGFVTFELENSISFKFKSYSYNGTEMLEMAETALSQN